MGEAVHGLQPNETAQPAGDLVDLLEVRIGDLVERHREARRAIARLRDDLRDRDRRIHDLVQRVQKLDRARGLACERVDRILARLDRIERA